VGCGSGAATLAAQEAVGVQGVVVGLDISPAMLRRASDGGVARLVHQREYSVTMATGDYLSMLDLFAYGRFLRQHLGPTRWQDFRESVAAKVAVHGLKAVEYTSRYHDGVGTRRG